MSRCLGPSPPGHPSRAYTALVESPRQRLVALIRDQGPIPFALFMEEALYGEGGYYSRESIAIGESGDFVTGSSLSPLFGRATALLLSALDGPLGRPADLLEVGYGNGVHLEAVRDALCPGDRRELAGWDRVARPLPEGVDRWSGLGSSTVEGLVFSYELFDALAVHRLIRRGDELLELHVSVDDENAFRWIESPLSSPELAHLPRAELAEGQIVDLSPGWAPLYRQLADSLERGLIVTCDYGFETERLYDVRVRERGTLACYRSQQVHRDPFVDVGTQDLTAHLDFSVLIEEGERAGLETYVFSRQAAWLAACGILEGLESASQAERLEAVRLMQLDGMGDEIRVLVQGRRLDWEGLKRRLPGLAQLSR